MFLGMAGAAGSGPLDDFWYQPVGGGISKSGSVVNAESAMRLATVYACVRALSEDIGKMPLLMYRRGANNSRERVTDHPIAKLLAAPNRALTGTEWREMGQSHVELRGNAYSEILYTGSKPRELRPLHPDYVIPELMTDYSLRYRIRDAKGGERILVQDEVLHIKSLCVSGPVGLNPIEANREALGAAMATQDYSASFFRNDARPGIWLKHPGAFKDIKQRDEFTSRFQQKFAGNGRGGVFLSEHDIELKTIDVKNTDAQFIESRKMQREEIAAIFRVPQHKVGILDKSTNNNIEHQGIEYVTDTLLGRCKRWEERLATQLLTESEQEEYFFEFLLTSLLRGDTKSRYEAYGLGINAGWLMRAEPRQFENLNPINGLDRPLLPLNTTQLDANGNPPPAPTPASVTVKPDKGRAERLARAAADRVIRKEIAAVTKAYERNIKSEGAFIAAVREFYTTHSTYVAEVMAMPEERVTAYIDAQIKELLAAVSIELSTRTDRVILAIQSWQPARAEELALLSAQE